MNWLKKVRGPSDQDVIEPQSTAVAALNEQLAQALQAGQVNQALQSLAAGAEVETPFFHARRQTWRTPLQQAVLLESPALVTALMARGADPLRAVDEQTFAPVLLAVIEQHQDTVTALARGGADFQAPVAGPFGDPISGVALVQLRNRPEFANWFCSRIAQPVSPERARRPKM